jgi:hypothetical protein
LFLNAFYGSLILADLLASSSFYIALIKWE